MSRQMTVTLNALDYEDEDDSLRAAADWVKRSLRLRGWDLDARWGDDQRDTILLTIPRPNANDAQGWDALRNLRCISCVDA